MASQPPQDGLVNIKLGQTTWKRRNAHEAEINLFNRYFEDNPLNQVDQVALLARPATIRRTPVGAGPIRGVYYEEGTFNNDLFVASGTYLYRVTKQYGKPDIVTKIPTITFQGDGDPSMVATVDNFLFITDGFTLYVYDPLAVPQVAIIDTPDDIPFNNLAFIAGFVICVQNNSQRFYWIRPGAKIIDSLDFAEAERFPDHVRQAMTLGDQFALLGAKTSEFWYATGAPVAPFERLQGRMFERGVWGGTAVKVADEIILVGDDGVVYDISGGPNRISLNGIEERIRNAMRIQASDQ